MAIVLTCDNRGPTGSCDTCGVSLNEHCPTHPMNPNNVRNVPCKWCDQKTNMLGTKACDNCHEMASRMERNPKLAQSIMDKLVPFTAQCVITGVIVQFVNAVGYAHADLFDCGSVWVIQRSGWIDESIDPSLKIITINTPLIERMGLIVVPKSVCVLSKAAEEYVNGN